MMKKMQGVSVAAKRVAPIGSAPQGFRSHKLQRFAAACTLIAAAFGFAPTALAQSKYPSKPIQLVVPYPPGGSDVLARRLAVGMGEKLGQTVVVVNKPGASTQIGTSYVVAAQPDGHTIYVASVADLAAGPSLFKSLPFDALKDLTPISYIADAPYILVGSGTSPHKGFTELTAYAKSNPEKIKLASYGVQSNTDILSRRFNLALGTSLQIIAYQGGSPAFNAIMRDEVQLLFPTTIASRQFIVSGQVRPFAIATEKRIPLYPDVPTLKELGVDLVDAAGFALFGPKGLPADVVQKVHEALVTETAKPEIKNFMADLGMIVLASTPDELAARLKAQTASWADLAGKIGLERQ